MPERAALSGPAAAGHYSQSLDCGNFYLVFSLSGPAEEVTLELGRNTVARLEEIAFQTPEITPQELVEILAEGFKQNVKLEIVVGKLIGNQLLLAGTDKTGAKIIRETKILNLLSSPVVSGPVKEGDLLVLGTKDFFENFPLTDLTKPGSLLPDFQDNFSLKIETLEQKPAVAALLERLTVSQESFSQPYVPPKRLLYLALVILVSLISLVAFQLRSKALEQRTGQEQAIEKQARDGLDAAKKLAGLNDNLARETLTQTKAALFSQSQNYKDSKRLQAILLEIDSQLATVGHFYQVPSLETFSDFALLRAQANITSVSLHTNQILALDGANGAVYSLGTKSKTAAIVGGLDDFKNQAAVDFSGNKGYVYTPSGIYFLSLTSPASPKQVAKTTEKFGQILGLRFFAGNLYLLDRNNSQIWKYQGTDLGFADPIPYLKSGGVDFSKVSSFDIDGSIWVLSTSGNVAKFSSGYAEDLNVSGLDTPFKNPTSIFTTDETNNVYVWDSGNNRVVVLDKKGVYQAQYIFPRTYNLEPRTLLLTDETVKKVFLLSGSKVYSFDLK